MLERILKLYVMAMAADVRSPLPHLFGPPGCGKSTVVEQLAELLGVNLHIINVSRMSPLEVEGVQMPIGMDGDNPVLRLLTATFWTQLKEGDILLLDEFLRAFPEVYNALLDILTSRQVGGYKLPKVFIIGASNSTLAYDKALEDRLHHIPAVDLRKSKAARKEAATLMVEALGLSPKMIESVEMTQLLNSEVLPMYVILDQMGKGTASPANVEGHSIRNLIGQAKMRDVTSVALAELLNMNNNMVVHEDKLQYLFLFDRKNPEMKKPGIKAKLTKLVDNPRLSPIQAENVSLNLQLIELEEQRTVKETDDDDDTGAPDDDLF